MANQLSETTIYVENFPLETSETTLRKLFQNFGKICNITIPTFPTEHPLCKGLAKPKTQGYAFIEFASIDHANMACDFFNDLKIVLCINNDSVYTNELNEKNDKMTEHSHYELMMKIRDNLEFRNLTLLRVMPMKNFNTLKEVFKEKRMMSLIGAAKLLVTM